MNKMGAMNAEEMKNYKGVFVFAQQVDNKLSGISFELIGEGKRLAEKLDEQVTAVLIGSDVKGLVDELAEYGADRVIVVDDPELKEYRTEPYAHALASVINEYKPEIVLVGATAIGRDLGPRVSARVKTGLTADCTVLEIGEFKGVANQLLMTRPAFGGNTIATIACPNIWQHMPDSCRLLHKVPEDELLQNLLPQKYVLYQNGIFLHASSPTCIPDLHPLTVLEICSQEPDDM